MTQPMTPLEKRCVEITYGHKLTHLSSVLNTVGLLERIYKSRGPNEPVVLGNGHAALAHYVVLESCGLCDAEEMLTRHGIHSNRDMEHGVWVTNGSLGQAETIAVGLAMADLKRKVWLITSDGACMEGAVYEAMRIANRLCPNLIGYVIFNGTGAYGYIKEEELPPNLLVMKRGQQLPLWLQGMKGHYLTLTPEQYGELMQ